VPLIRDPQKIGKHEKALWTFVLFALLMLEIKSVYQDRNEHDREQAEARERETKSFEKIANGIEGAIQQAQDNFAATMKQFGESVKTITGGSSFPIVWSPFIPMVQTRSVSLCRFVDATIYKMFRSKW
jgi:hypothetical protein